MLLGYQNGEDSGEEEQGDGQVNGELLKYVGGLGTEHLAGHVATESGAEALLAGALHEHDEDQKQTDDDLNDRQKGDQDGHKGRGIWSFHPIWQAVLCLFTGNDPDALGGEVGFGKVWMPFAHGIRESSGPLIRGGECWFPGFDFELFFF